MRPLARSIADLRVAYDVVVVGSGYGGGVAASRLARSGKRVCLLERGREFPIGDFPDTPTAATREVQITREGKHLGDDMGLYDLRLGKDMHVFVGCGLGGTSLLNANVALPIDERVWEDPVWPDELVADADRKLGETRARNMLSPMPYPEKVPLAKLSALRLSAGALGAGATKPPVNVTFERTINPANVEQPACTLCGDCCSGCNVGAKNTTQMNYLPDAANHGAEIFTGCQVRHVRKEGGKWRVFFDLIGSEREAFDSPAQSIVADVVVLAAGTLGSTEILLRSKENGLALSDRVGRGFTGNGDIIAFAYNNDQEINGIGVGHPPKADQPPVGPCISGAIDLRRTDDFEKGMIIEEGSIPSGLAPILPVMMAPHATVFGDDTDRGLKDELGERAQSLKSLLRGPYTGAVNRTQTFLVMSHDSASGEMDLENDRLRVTWPDVADEPGLQGVEEKLRAATAALGGTYTRNPITEKLLGNNLITVHPLGGCAIGHDRRTGVVNHKCQVFDGSDALGNSVVHDGLYVCDGSIMPRSLGVNPLLTITTLSERAMIHLARDRGWTFDDKPKADAPLSRVGLVSHTDAKPVGLEFTERMAGWITETDAGDYESARKDGKAANNAFAFTTTVVIDDVDRFLDDESHAGRLIGTVDCPALSSEPIDAFAGTFNLMHPDAQAVDTRRFDYKMVLAAKDGQRYLFTGHKVVRSDAGLDLWDDTTTLFVDIYKGADGRDGLLMKGVLKIDPDDFRKQLRTFRASNGRTRSRRLQATANFGRLFAGSLFDVYGGIFVPTTRFDDTAPRRRRELRAPEPQTHHVATEDGKTLRLLRYKGGNKGPVMLTHGLGVSGKIFSLDTIDTNVVEYLCAADYDCWVLDYRASIDLPYARDQWTGDEIAAHDYPAAVDFVREATGAADIQVLAHCFGATTFFMAMLSGLEGVRSAVISQIATDVVIPWWPQRLLAHLRTPTLFDALGINTVNARAEVSDKAWERALDWLIRTIAPIPREEKSSSATSNRIAVLYGPLYELDQLNQATVNFGLPETFGHANISAFRHLARIGRKQVLVDAQGNDVYMPHVDRLAIPIHFIHGAENACFDPVSTQRTLERLSAANGSELYSRKVIPGYGHIDCIFGKNAADDVYPEIVRHLEKTV